MSWRVSAGWTRYLLIRANFFVLRGCSPDLENPTGHQTRHAQGHGGAEIRPRTATAGPEFNH